jgi:hypothetical protein
LIEYVEVFEVNTDVVSTRRQSEKFMKIGKMRGKTRSLDRTNGLSPQATTMNSIVIQYDNFILGEPSIGL